MRKEDLREATKRRRSGTVTSSRPVCRRGEKRKRKATVAAVYSIERQVRMPGSIRAVESQKEEAPQVRARHNRVWASVERSPNR